MAKTKAKAKKTTKATQSAPTKDDELQEIGRRAFESIAEMVARLDAMEQVSECCCATTTTTDGIVTCDACDAPCTLQDDPVDADETAREKARQEIQEDPLSVQVRSDWYSPGEESTPGEYQILLSWGGPATRIIGDLNEHGEPMRATLEAQDWGTPWTEYRGAWANGGAETLLAYARQFYYVST